MKASYYIESLGCISNQVDAERVSAFLLANGWLQTRNIEEASVVILMTCGFTQASEAHNLRVLRDIKSRKSREATILVGGCLPSINKEALRKEFTGFVFSPRTLHRLDDQFNASVSIEAIPPVLAPASDPTMATIRVSTGCMSRCSYCAIPFANGRTRSRRPEHVVDDIRRCQESGQRAVRLVSEDIGAYGADIDSDVVQLLERILSSDTQIKIYLDNLNPNWLIRFYDRLSPLFRSERIAKSFYVPIQSGSDRILTLMRREYAVSEAMEVMERLRREFKDIRLTSDVIVGFPTETDEDFQATVRMVERAEFDYLEVFTYEDRPRIEAAALTPQVPVEVKEQRRVDMLRTFMRMVLRRENVVDAESLSEMFRKLDGLPFNTNLILH
jgi:MiaB/RimO family radical SAM methylthiotransferase